MRSRSGRAVLITLLAAATMACTDEDGGLTGPVLEGVDLELVAQGLVSPVMLAEPSDNSHRLFVADQIGRIRIIDANGQLLTQPFLDISTRMVALNAASDERGLLGLAFHPAYATNRRFYVYYSAPRRAGAPTNWNHTSNVSEFTTLASDPNRADPASERVVIQIDQPQANHNGGMLAFATDGTLYISLGDGGAANDVGIGHPPGGNGQALSVLLGKILRIGVDMFPYSIPATNPFASRPDARAEVWAYGFRNPYRFSFDRQTGDLIAGDVGQNRWEEVDRVVRGGNYGWNIREGLECFNINNANLPLTSCPSTGGFGEPLLEPVIVYSNSGRTGAGELSGLAVIGGYVYRGTRIPGLLGRYVFGDFSGPRGGLLLVATPSPTGAWTFLPLQMPDRGDVLGHLLKGFGEDQVGNIYVLTSDEQGPTGTTGRVYRIVPRTQ